MSEQQIDQQANFRLVDTTKSEIQNALFEIDKQTFRPVDWFKKPSEYAEYSDVHLIFVGHRIAGSMAFEHDIDIERKADGALGDNYVRTTGTLYIVNTAILPEFQRRGIGKKAKEWQIAHAKEQGFTRIVTYPRKSNAAIVGLNRKFGFEIVMEIPAGEWYDKEPALCMELDLMK
jgi:ribosomal protein S18 acetylase RimI-like enzyme